MKLNIALLAGDGIGPEVIDQAVKSGFVNMVPLTVKASPTLIIRWKVWLEGNTNPEVWVVGVTEVKSAMFCAYKELIPNKKIRVFKCNFVFIFSKLKVTSKLWIYF